MRSDAPLRELQAKAELIMNEIDNALGRLDPNECPDAVNWGDIGCCDVSLVLTGPEPSWRATVTEAAPDCPNLSIYLHKELEKLGYDVYITTEW